MESDKKDIIFDLRDSGTVTITIEQFVHLVSCEARLSILQQTRVAEIMERGSAYRQQSDYVLGKPVMDAWSKRDEGGLEKDV